ncbi:NAD(P)-linked oxidoreductase [Glarea lozoyensis ATCC 20868]|uniref:NAD(P)-linked oxidoreductase n=2 Tax=Glarea lozoyensis TaxID=101852 RepID=S3DE90_GLAL2|nr:NAD(P)-linked oxidoreductase [Glarea lozoyensis ATCC 20868]EHK99249.1 putative Pyridoxal reductase [Glarea lozoyensis 74030]EPE36732.1 NAD(P)-linked oxidoreductase [Glarea lozoyensis ATCC 20868]
MSLSVAGKKAGPIGFGLLGLSRPPAIPYDQAIKVMKAALNHGANLWNGAEFYGTPTENSLHLLNHYFTTYPEDAAKVIITLKGAFTMSMSPPGPQTNTAGIRQSIDNCLAILDDKVFLDVFLPARIDPDVPIEETVTAIVEYIKAGKIGGYGLSECSAQSIRRAHAIHPLSMIEIELSLFATEIFSNDVADVCAELHIPIIAYSPLARGFLAGGIKKAEDLPQDDIRRRFPRFQDGALEANIKLAEKVREVAERTGFTMAQVAIAWVRRQGGRLGTVIPIPGCTTLGRLEDNMRVVEVGEEELKVLDGLSERMRVVGERYPEAFLKYTYV